MGSETRCLSILQSPDDNSFAPPQSPPRSSRGTPSVFSRDIWLGDNSGESQTFARDIEIVGWTSVGDRRGGAYIGNLFSCPSVCLTGAE